MEYIKQFLTIQQQVRMYHWTSKIYNQHVITGKLYEKLDEKIDEFIEILLADREVEGTHLTIRSVSFLNRQGLLKKLNEFIVYLQGFDNDLSSDLLNVRDEILGVVHQHIYLLKMD
jgi:DNA-binding ferritin-like protein